MLHVDAMSLGARRAITTSPWEVLKLKLSPCVSKGKDESADDVRGWRSLAGPVAREVLDQGFESLARLRGHT